MNLKEEDDYDFYIKKMRKVFDEGDSHPVKSDSSDWGTKRSVSTSSFRVGGLLIPI